MKELSEEDEKHVSRLRALRQSGTVNMATELRHGLTEVFGTEDGLETYEWVQENQEYYLSGEWTRQD